MRKFPVTTPDGTKFLVKIRESPGSYDTAFGERIFLSMPCVKISVFLPRKLRNKLVFTKEYEHGTGVYDVTAPDFVLLVQTVMRDYCTHLMEAVEEEEAERRVKKSREQAAKRFGEWDGKITI